MSEVYDNWERLVGATLRREDLRISGQRTPSDLSSASSSSFSFSDSSGRLSFLGFPGSPVGVAFDYNQILRATNYFSYFNRIMSGRSGHLYKGVLECGTPVVVKKAYNWTLELEAYGKVSHPRFVPLLGHCLDLDKKFLIYKCMSKGDLESSLNEAVFAKRDNGFKPLDWMARLKIATGAAEALCYLHHECVPPLVHGYVQASSILLDDNFEVRLGSLSTVCAQQSGSESSNPSRRPVEFPDSCGCQRISDYESCTYDVYCFGKVLLELVTGRPDVSAAENYLTMDDWINETLSNVTTSNMEVVKRIADPSLSLNDDLLMEVWAVAIIAQACLTPQPNGRPLMRHVLRALQNPARVVTAKDGGNWARVGSSNDPSAN